MIFSGDTVCLFLSEVKSEQNMTFHGVIAFIVKLGYALAVIHCHLTVLPCIIIRGHVDSSGMANGFV